MKTISEILLDAVRSRIESGESLFSLAKEARLDYPSLNKWLKEGRDIRASTIDRLAEYLGLTLVKEKPAGKGK